MIVRATPFRVIVGFVVCMLICKQESTLAMETRVAVAVDGSVHTLIGQARYTNLTIDEVILDALKESHGRVNGPVNSDPNMILSEMDMELTKDQLNLLHGSSNETTQRVKRKTERATTPWAKGVLYFKLYPGHFNDEDSYWLKRSMTEWERYTCIRFKRAGKSTKNYALLQSGLGCNSMLGMMGGRQILNLQSPGCRFKGLYLHEFGHALGLVHEQMLPNRDQHIRVILSNVQAGLEDQFTKYKSSEVFSFNTKYELSSVMHYGNTAFSKDGTSKTIQVLDRSKEHELGKVYLAELSFSDVKAINTFYKCNKGCSKSIRCSGGGYVDENCRCICPDGSHDCADGSNNRRSACTNKYWSSWMCYIWANQGECERNPDYMKINCKKACGACRNRSPEENCIKDKYPKDKCFIWVVRGECITNKRWMKKNCNTACKFCKPDRKKTNCKNRLDDRKCNELAMSGDCRANPAYTQYNCQRSCELCHKKVSPPKEIRRKLGNCRNIHGESECEEWAERGECYHNPFWMWVNCPRSCNTCSKKSRGKRTILDGTV